MSTTSVRDSLPIEARTLAELVKLYRERGGMTQEELAQRASASGRTVSKQTIHNIEKGGEPSGGRLYNIASALVTAPGNQDIPFALLYQEAGRLAAAAKGRLFDPDDPSILTPPSPAPPGTVVLRSGGKRTKGKGRIDRAREQRAA